MVLFTLLDFGINAAWLTCKQLYSLCYYMIYGSQPSEYNMLMIEMNKLNDKIDKKLDTDFCLID